MKVWIITALLLACSIGVRADTIPDFLFREMPVAEESDEAIQTLVEEAANQLSSAPDQARRGFIRALGQVGGGGAISEYDYLWAYQGLMATCYDAANVLKPGTREAYIGLGRRAIAHLDEKSRVGSWVYTPDGAALLAFYRTIGNNLAWVLHEDPEGDSAALAEALRVIERAESYIMAPEDYFVLDTKVRILLTMGRKDDAFAQIRKVLDEVPDFQWFQEFLQDADYRAWLEANPA